jgi:hypothetical protein
MCTGSVTSGQAPSPRIPRAEARNEGDIQGSCRLGSSFLSQFRGQPRVFGLVDSHEFSHTLQPEVLYNYLPIILN